MSLFDYKEREWICRTGVVPTVGGLKFSMPQKIAKISSWGKCQLEEMPIQESASWRSASCGTGSKNLTL